MKFLQVLFVVILYLVSFSALAQDRPATTEEPSAMCADEMMGEVMKSVWQTHPFNKATSSTPGSRKEVIPGPWCETNFLYVFREEGSAPLVAITGVAKDKKELWTMRLKPEKNADGDYLCEIPDSIPRAPHKLIVEQDGVKALLRLNTAEELVRTLYKDQVGVTPDKVKEAYQQGEMGSKYGVWADECFFHVRMTLTKGAVVGPPHYAFQDVCGNTLWKGPKWTVCDTLNICILD